MFIPLFITSLMCSWPSSNSLSTIMKDLRSFSHVNKWLLLTLWTTFKSDINEVACVKLSWMIPFSLIGLEAFNPNHCEGCHLKTSKDQGRGHQAGSIVWSYLWTIWVPVLSYSWCSMSCIFSFWSSKGIPHGANRVIWSLLVAHHLYGHSPIIFGVSHHKDITSLMATPLLDNHLIPLPHMISLDWSLTMGLVLPLIPP